jgi:hypothetical protein
MFLNVGLIYQDEFESTKLLTSLTPDCPIKCLDVCKHQGICHLGDELLIC